MKVKGCIKELSNEWKNKAKADYVLFIERAEKDIISTFVTKHIFPDGHNIPVDNDFKTFKFQEIEIKDVKNKDKKETQFASISELLKSTKANKTYTSKHSY